MNVDARAGRAAAESDGHDLAMTVLLGGVSLAVALLVALEVEAPLLSLVVTLFLLTVPGATVVRLLGFRGPLLCGVLAVAVSIVVDLHLAVLHVVAGLWEPRSAVVALALASAALAGVPLLQRHEER